MSELLYNPAAVNTQIIEPTKEKVDEVRARFVAIDFIELSIDEVKALMNGKILVVPSEYGADLFILKEIA